MDFSAVSTNMDTTAYNREEATPVKEEKKSAASVAARRALLLKPTSIGKALAAATAKPTINCPPPTPGRGKGTEVRYDYNRKAWVSVNTDKTVKMSRGGEEIYIQTAADRRKGAGVTKQRATKAGNLGRRIIFGGVQCGKDTRGAAEFRSAAFAILQARLLAATADKAPE